MSKLRRRLVSIPTIVLIGVALVVLVPIWLPVALIVDLVRAPRRLPITRLLMFGVCWAWIETLGMVRLGWIWLTRGTGDLVRLTEVQRWWASSILTMLRITAGLRVELEGIDAYNPSPVVVMPRHASLIDSVLSTWVIVGPAKLQARVVLKRELLVDPVLDVAGNWLRNHFVDRGASDSSAELAALTELTSDMGPEAAAMIFPEGTRANPEKRARALAKIAERDPERSARLSVLRHLMPPRPAGSAALLAGAPTADVVLAWHTGLDGMDSFGGILRGVPTFAGRTIHYAARRIPRADVPAANGEGSGAFTRWLDDTWLALDREIGATLAGPTST